MSEEAQVTKEVTKRQRKGNKSEKVVPQPTVEKEGPAKEETPAKEGTLTETVHKGAERSRSSLVIVHS